MAVGNTQLQSALGTLGQAFSPQRLGLLLGIAAAAAAIFGMWLWTHTPDYRVLFANLSDRDGGAVVAALQQMNVPYKFADGGGAILVPANQVHDTRLRLAGQGLPRGSLVGFELMENARLGTSQFMEQINYQRALEGELARSIQSIAAVESARVHLAMAKPSVFVREQQKPTASVILNLRGGRTLDAPQVSAIVHLVSSSVPDLAVSRVTVLDQEGTLLSAQSEGGAYGTLDAVQLKYVRDLEAGYVKRIESILAPIVGSANVRAQVSADVDFTQVKWAEETYKPNQVPTSSAIRSQQTSESNNPAGAQGSGVPGALSNQPPAPASAPIVGDAAPTPASRAATAAAATAASATASAAAAATAATAAAAAAAAKDGKLTPVLANPAAAADPLLQTSSTRRDATTNYEVDRTIRHVRQPVGTVRRVSAAVVINYRKQTGADRKVAFRPLSEDEMTQINAIVKETIGFTQARGDSLNVMNRQFTVPEQPEAVNTPVWKDPGSIDIALTIGRYVLFAAVALYLIFAVLRPMFRSLTALPAPPVLPPQALPDAGAAPGLGARSYENNLQAARLVAQQEPRLVANVVKNWMEQ